MDPRDALSDEERLVALYGRCEFCRSPRRPVTVTRRDDRGQVSVHTAFDCDCHCAGRLLAE